MKKVLSLLFGLCGIFYGITARSEDICCQAKDVCGAVCCPTKGCNAEGTGCAKCDRGKVEDKDGNCCDSGYIDNNGNCCYEHLDGNNNCCSEGYIDNNGYCCDVYLDPNGNCCWGTIDNSGYCCNATLDNNGYCCDSGYIDNNGNCCGYSLDNYGNCCDQAEIESTGACCADDEELISDEWGWNYCCRPDRAYRYGCCPDDSEIQSDGGDCCPSSVLDGYGMCCWPEYYRQYYGESGWGLDANQNCCFDYLDSNGYCCDTLDNSGYCCNEYLDSNGYCCDSGYIDNSGYCCNGDCCDGYALNSSTGKYTEIDPYRCGCPSGTEWNVGSDGGYYCCTDGFSVSGNSSGFIYNVTPGGCGCPMGGYVTKMEAYDGYTCCKDYRPISTYSSNNMNDFYYMEETDLGACGCPRSDCGFRYDGQYCHNDGYTFIYDGWDGFGLHGPEPNHGDGGLCPDMGGYSHVWNPNTGNSDSNYNCCYTDGSRPYRADISYRWEGVFNADCSEFVPYASIYPWCCPSGYAFLESDNTCVPISECTSVEDVFCQGRDCSILGSGYGSYNGYCQYCPNLGSGYSSYNGYCQYCPDVGSGYGVDGYGNCVHCASNGYSGSVNGYCVS